MKILVLGLIVSMIIAPGFLFISNEIYLNENDGIPICPKIDETPPNSTVKVCPRVLLHPENCYCLPTVMVQWGGADDWGGSGIATYDVQFKRQYVCIDPDNVYAAVLPFWQDWQINTTNTSAIFYPSLDEIYLFRCRAIDNQGNIENWPKVWDTFLICIGVSGSVEIVEEVRDGLENWIGSIDNKVDEMPIPVNRISKKAEEIRTNQAPIADGGDTYHGTINKFPTVYNDISEIDIIDRYPVIEFNGSNSYDSDGEIIGYLWNFGDGRFGQSEITDHRYFVKGEYKVKLLVIDNLGSINLDIINCTIDVAY